MRTDKKINLPELKTEIIKRYGSYAECARNLNVSATQLSRWLKKPSERFYLLLIEHELIKPQYGEKDKWENNYFMEEYRKIIEEQGKLLVEQRKTIAALTKILEKTVPEKDTEQKELD
jgi:hypothetical protein